MSFPPSVLERAADRKLGEPVRAFDGRVGLRRALVWAGPAVLAGPVLVLAAVVLLAAGHSALGTASAVLAVGAAGAVVSFARSRGIEPVRVPAELRSRNRVVYLFGGGFVVEPGGAYGWDDLVSVGVSGVRHATQGRTRYRFLVVAADGSEIVLDRGLPDVRDLGETVLMEVAGRALPRLLERVRGGETVRMGPFEVCAEAVEKEGERLAWPALGEAGVDNGVVYVRTRDDVCSLTAIAAQVPNTVAFVELCRALAAGEEVGAGVGDGEDEDAVPRP
ncbi:DUF6585 family protein [Actinomadura rugatobispora]|uniref:DUF6585 family protein n=1 Tax=Actinomadura rugatobispora TaxID=1994 RepID=A0ABW1AC40_9ACTN|nr:hypothetical protein GCM10010200_051880 [Actinomadura rugatobispora]